MLDKPFKDANIVIQTIENHGYSAYYVGGCIRDYLLNKKINDIDIATSALPEQIQEIFDRVFPVGIDHGTVLVRHNHNSYEVTTYRGKTDDRDKINTNNINDDLSRRDFTINALAMNKQGEILDLFNGENDLNNKLIKTVGSPEDRFKEDPLRIIRALRFSSQLGFEIDKKTLETMIELKPLIKHISIERITTEMIKLFTGNYFNISFQYLLMTEIYNELPIFKEHQQLIKHLSHNVVPFNQFSEVISYFYLLDESISINQWIAAWKESNQVKREVINLTNAIKNYKINGINAILLYELNIELFGSFIHVVNLHFKKSLNYDELLKQKKALIINSRKDLNITGYDITRLFPERKKGKWIEDIISKIEKEVLLKRLNNDKKMIKEWIKCNRLEIN